MLHLHELTLEFRILGIGLEPTKIVEVALPAMADLGSDQRAETGVASQKPAARRDAVGLVVELPGIERIELGEEIALEKLGVECGHAIHRVASNDREVGHPHHLGMPLLDEGEFADHLHVAGPHGLHLEEEELVDLKNDLQVPWKNLLKQSDTPLLQGLWQKGVIRVGKGPGHDLPSLPPRESVHVVEQALKLDHGDGRVGVVELDGDFIREIVPVVVAPTEASDDILERAGYEEILLDQAEFLAAFGLIIRVEDLGNGLAGVLVTHCFVVAAAVEGFEVEVLSRL